MKIGVAPFLWICYNTKNTRLIWCTIPIYREGTALNKKLGRLLQPNMGFYFMLLLGFALATALLEEYVLAGIELAVWVLVMALYLIQRTNRRKQIKAFVEKVTNEQSGVQGQRPPFPMVVVTGVRVTV